MDTIEFTTSDGKILTIPIKSKLYKVLIKLSNSNSNVALDFSNIYCIFYRTKIPRSKIIHLFKIYLPLGITEINEILIEQLNKCLDLEIKNLSIINFIINSEENITFKNFENKIKENLLIGNDFKKIKRPNDIYNYKYFDNDILVYYMEIFFECFKDYGMMKHIIDGCLNLECEDNKKYRPIHYICQFSTCKIIKYIVDKGVNLECEGFKKWRPIHLICNRLTPKFGTFHNKFGMIKYMISKGINLDCETEDKWRPIHLVCKCASTPETIKYMIDKGVNLECEDMYGCRPIHYICRYSTPEMIKYIIDKGVDLKCKNDDGYTPMDLISKYSTQEMKEYVNKINDLKNKKNELVIN